MRIHWFAAAFAAAVLIGPGHKADAGMIGMPMQLRTVIQRIKFEAPALAPMAYTQFCRNYSDDCAIKPIRFRGGPVRMNAERWQELIDTNRDVNQSISPEPNYRGILAEKWVISPDAGDCNDYAVTKRHELIEMGWPARSLLLSEVIIPSGEHHLVVVVRTNEGDLVLDNLSPQIRRWHQAPYRWLRIQRPDNARLWATIAPRGGVKSALSS